MRKTKFFIALILSSGPLLLAGCSNLNVKEAPAPSADPVIAGNRTIDLGGMNLDKLPAEALSDVRAKKLILSNNKLKSLPAEIGRLTSLEELYVDGNLLEGALPAEIRKMARLRILDASDNNLTGIPAEIGQLKQLEILDLSGNEIDTFPDELGNLKGNLKTIDLTQNSFKAETISEIRKKLPETKIAY